MFQVYEIPDNYITGIEKLLYEHDINKGAETEEDYKARLATYLAELGSDTFDQKCIHIAMYQKNLDAQAAGIKESIALMQKRMADINKDSAALNNFLNVSVESAGLLSPIKSNYFNIKRVKNPARLIITDADAIPDIYKTSEVVFSLDNEKIKSDLKEGFVVEGAKLLQLYRLEIK
jgi:hypothetical protein